MLDVATRRDDLGLLDVHRQTAFTFDARDRMVHESAPDRSRGRRFSFTGCRQGNRGVIRDDVADDAAAELEQLLSGEPPLFASDAQPRHMDAYTTVLGAEPEGEYLGLLWSVPVSVPVPDGVDVVSSGTQAGDALVDRFDEVLSPSLRRSFPSADELWAPWCVALVEGEIASIAETVRRGAGGAEVGVDTAERFRGRGLAAAATAGWSRHPELKDCALFYSTGRQNISSRRVTERLGLRLLGSTLGIP